MATYSDTSLQDTDTDYSAGNRINGGTALEMNCTGINYTMQSFQQIPQLPAKSIDQTHSGLLAKHDYLGISNPNINLKGVISLRRYNTTTGAAPSNEVTLPLLQQIMKCGHKFTLTDKYDTDTTTDIFRISTITGTYPNETASTITCVPIQLTIDTNPVKSTEGHILNYVLVLQEVQ